MARKPSTPAVKPGVNLASTSSERAPFVYFDGVSRFGINNGVIAIELAANTFMPLGAGYKVDVLQTAHLRCSPTAAAALRTTLDRALKLLQQAQRQAAEIVPASKH